MSERFGGFTERRVHADGFDVRVVQAGSGDPLIYIHGGGGLHLLPPFGALALDHHFVAIEVPGFGDSPVNERTQSFDELAQTIASTIAAAGIDGPFSLVGTSFGGACALHVALRDPGSLTALVLISPAAFRPERWGPVPPGELLQTLYAHPERRAPQEPISPEVMAKQQRLTGRLIETIDGDSLRARIQAFEVPTLVAFGTEDRRIPPEMGRIYRELMPNCSYILVWDAGHEMWSDRPQATVTLVNDFLARREMFVIGDTVAPVAP